MTTTINLVVHDYAGHPFAYELSKELAARGHVVEHVYSAAVVGPKYSFSEDIQNNNLTVTPISIGRRSSKDNFVRRFFDELQYGMVASSKLVQSDCDIIISANLPIVPHVICRVRARRSKQIFWLQDRLGIAAKLILEKKLGGLGSLLGTVFEAAERKLLKHATHVVAICDTFKEYAIVSEVASSKVTVIENWAPLTLLSDSKMVNSCSENMDGARRIVYSGTLGHKHRPEDIFQLAQFVDELDDPWKVIVTCSGYGFDVLENMNTVEPCKSLVLAPPVPYDELQSHLSQADIFLASLELDGADYCVPSKVLTYMGMCRPTILIGPFSNRISEILVESGGGLSIEVINKTSFNETVLPFINDEYAQKEAGTRAGIYAKQYFDIRRKADKFEGLLLSVYEFKKSDIISV